MAEQQKKRAPFFEKTSVGSLKERVHSMTDAQVENELAEYGIPSPGEIEKPGTYIQNTVRKELVENRRKNDVVKLRFAVSPLIQQKTI